MRVPPTLTLLPSHTFLRFSSCPLETATVGCSRKENNHIMYHCVQKTSDDRILCIIQNVVTNSNRCAITDEIAGTPRKSEMLCCAIIVGLAKYRRGKIWVLLESSTSPLSKEPKIECIRSMVGKLCLLEQTVSK